MPPYGLVVAWWAPSVRWYRSDPYWCLTHLPNDIREGVEQGIPLTVCDPIAGLEPELRDQGRPGDRRRREGAVTVLGLGRGSRRYRLGRISIEASDSWVDRDQIEPMDSRRRPRLLPRSGRARRGERDGRGPRVAL